MLYSSYLAPFLVKSNQFRSYLDLGTKQNSTGIAISADSIQVIQISNKAGYLYLNNYLQLNTLNKNPFNDETAKHLKYACEDISLSGKKVCSIVFDRNCSIKHLKFPDIPEAELVGSVRFSEKDSLSFPMDTASISILPLKNSSDNGTRTILSAFMDSKAVLKYFNFFRKTSLKLISISTLPSAILGLIQHSTFLKKLETIPILVFSNSETGIYIIRNCEIVYSRVISIGVNNLESSVAVNSDSKRPEPYQDYETRKIAFYPLHNTDATFSTVNEKGYNVSEKLCWEIDRSTSYFQNEFGWDKPKSFYYFFNGINPSDENISNSLNDFENTFSEMGFSLKKYNPFDDFLNETEKHPNLHKIGHFLAVTVGLALDKGKTLNLLPPNMRHSIKNTILNNFTSFLLLIISIVLIFASSYIDLYINNLKNELAQNYTADNLQMTVEATHDSIYYEEEINKLDSQLRTLPTAENDNLSFVEFSKYIQNAIPNNIALTNIAVIKKTVDIPSQSKYIGTNNIILKGKIRGSHETSINTLNKFIVNLKNTGYFTYLNPSSFSANKNINNGDFLFFVIEGERNTSLW